MEKTQSQQPCTVLYLGHKGGAPAGHDTGGAYRSLYHGIDAIAKTPYGRHLGAILVAQWEVVEQVPDMRQTQFFKATQQFWSNTA